MIYHVAPAHHEGPLLSLARQHGTEAGDIYCERWPEADAALGAYHAEYIHCYDTLEQAVEHAEVYGGVVLEIDESDLDVVRDTLEFDHPMVRDEIPESAIQDPQ